MRAIYCLLVLFVMLLTAAFTDAADQRSASKDYQVIIWSVGDIPADNGLWFKRLSEIGVSASMCYRGNSCEPFINNNFGYYVENLVPELAHLHSRKAHYEADYNAYITDRSIMHLVRKPCFDDPSYWPKAESELSDLIKLYAGKKALYFNLQDEPSLTSYANPMDYCFCEHTLQAFRVWLKNVYSSVDVLNVEWETDFKSWDDVVPMTTYEVKNRERKHLTESKPVNYAPWADHREYMDTSYTEAVKRLGDVVKKIEPGALTGLEGMQMPSTWGGFDMWKMSKVLDWCEPYDIGNSREILRSFLPFGTPVIATIFGNDYNRIKLQLWSRLLHGDSGCLIWDDDDSRCIDKNSADLKIADRGRALGEIFKGIKKIAPKIMPAQRQPARVAVHYSQASIRAHWMFDSREDNDTWHRRFSSYEAQYSRFSLLRESVLKLLEDIGVQYDFMSYEQIEKGKLDNKQYDILILPQSVAMSVKECEMISKFATNGGIVIADCMTATMDNHCKRLDRGQLDNLFGISRDSLEWTVEPRGGILKTDNGEFSVYESGMKTQSEAAQKSDNDSACLVRNRTGKGSAVYLNLDIRSYTSNRYKPAGKALRSILAPMFNKVRNRYIISASDGEWPSGAEMVVHAGMKSDIVAIIHNPSVRADSLGAVTLFGECIVKKAPMVLALPGKKKITDLQTGKILGTKNKLEFILDPWTPAIFEIQH